MKLQIKERILLLGVLPKETNFLTLKITRKLEDNLALTEKEIKEYEVKQDGNHLTWNAEKDKGVDIEIGEKAMDIITEALKKIDKENKLTKDYIGVYEKFIKE